MFVLTKDEVRIIIPISDHEDLYNIQKAIIATLQQCSETSPTPLNGVHAFHMLTLLESMLPTMDQLKKLEIKNPCQIPVKQEEKEMAA